MRSLVIAEQTNGQLRAGTLSAITAASGLGFNTDVLVIGEGAEHAANSAAQIVGVSKVVIASAGGYSSPESQAALIASLVPEGYSHVLTDATAQGRSILPRVAAILDVALLSDVIGIEGSDVFLRPIYAGNAIAKVRSLDSVKLFTARASAFEAAAQRTEACEQITVDTVSKTALSRFVNEQLITSARPELASARIVVSGGRGLQSNENFVLVERVADKLGGAVGASRAAVDSGFASNDLQVGQTGKIVAPDLYIAAGISGAIQHLAGMSGSKIIVAINNDPEAPITQVADYTLIADLFEALPALEREL